MAKISLLPALAAPDGSEQLPVVKNGKTFVAPIAKLLDGRINAVIGNDFASSTLGKADVAPTAQVWSPVWIILPQPSPTTSRWLFADIAVAQAQAVTFSVYDRAADGKLTRTAMTTRYVKAGVNRRIEIDLPIAAGQYVGLRCGFAPHYTNPGGAPVWFSREEIVTAGTVEASAPVTVEFNATIQGAKQTMLDRGELLRAKIGTGFDQLVLGKTPVMTGAVWTSADIVLPNAVPISGFVTDISIAVEQDQTVDVIAVTPDANGSLTCTARQQISAKAGVNVGLKVVLPIAAGQYVGFRCGVAPEFTNGSGQAVLFSSDQIAVGTVPRVSGPVTLEFGATIKGEILGQLERIGDRAQDTPLFGKKWVALGSSITIGAAYTTVVQSKTGMALLNLGYSGGSIGIASNGHYGSRKIYDQIALIPLDTELVTLECGPNDFGAAAVPLGFLGDQTLGTYYGALFRAMADIYARVPNARLVILTPYSGGAGTSTHRILTPNENGNYFQQFQDAVVDVAELLGWPLIDVGRGAGIGYLNAAVLTSDSLHLNAAGGARSGGFIVAGLDDLYDAGYFTN